MFVHSSLSKLKALLSLLFPFSFSVRTNKVWPVESVNIDKRSSNKSTDIQAQFIFFSLSVSISWSPWQCVTLPSLSNGGTFLNRHGKYYPDTCVSRGQAVVQTEFLWCDSLGKAISSFWPQACETSKTSWQWSSECWVFSRAFYQDVAFHPVFETLKDILCWETRTERFEIEFLELLTWIER